MKFSAFFKKQNLHLCGAKLLQKIINALKKTCRMLAKRNQIVYNKTKRIIIYYGGI